MIKWRATRGRFFEYVREIKEYFDHCQMLTWLAQVFTKAALSLLSWTKQRKHNKRLLVRIRAGRNHSTVTIMENRFGLCDLV